MQESNKTESESGFIFLSDDQLIEHNDFKTLVATPYFKDVFKDLSAHSADKKLGISLVAFLNVSSPARPTYF